MNELVKKKLILKERKTIKEDNDKDIHNSLSEKFDRI